MAHPLLERRNRVPRADGVVGEAERRRQRRELRRGDLAQPGERGVGAEPGAERGDGSGAAEEALGKQAADGGQGACPAVATASSSSASVPGSRAARQSGSLPERGVALGTCTSVSFGHVKRAIRVPGGVLRA